MVYIKSIIFIKLTNSSFASTAVCGREKPLSFIIVEQSSAVSFEKPCGDALSFNSS